MILLARTMGGMRGRKPRASGDDPLADHDDARLAV